MKVFTAFEAAYLPILDTHFLPSLPAGCDPQLHELQSPAAEFGTPGFRALMIERMVWLGQALGVCVDGEVIGVADADVRWYDPDFCVHGELLLMGDDIAFADDGANRCPCAGFWLARISPALRMFMAAWESSLLKADPGPLQDQAVLRAMLPSSGLKWHLLDQNVVWTTRFRYTPGMDISVPENLSVHHANWTVGIDNKLEILGRVQALVSKQS